MKTEKNDQQYDRYLVFKQLVIRILELIVNQCSVIDQ